MKTVVSINSGNFGSTGNIMIGISDTAQSAGYRTYTACPDGRSMRRKMRDNHLFIGSIIGRNLHLQTLGRLGFPGCGSMLETRAFLRKIEELYPEIIHLHNLHNCYINLPMLFRYLKKKKLKVVWTLHDCWAFTGQCPYFELARCDKWKTGCHHCPVYRQYPGTMVDNTKTMWKWKKKWFTGLENLTIVTPSQWLGDLVKESYLGEYPVRVIYNGIDLSVFQPTQSAFREKYGIPEDKKIILGVAFGWGKRKGLDVFLELAERLGSQYQVVLVGTNEAVDAQLPANIISIHRTQDQRELAEIYTAADVFANPTREEVLGLVNIESLACGTPVVTFRTGGSPECIDETCGVVVECDDVAAMTQEIERICTQRPYSQEACRMRAKKFAKDQRFQEYVSLYGSL